jgi:hypothetical protein
MVQRLSTCLDSLGMRSEFVDERVGGIAAEWPEERSAPRPAVTLTPRHLMVWIWTATVAVFGVGVFREVYIRTYGRETAVHGMDRLGLDYELSLPAWYSSALMAISAGLLVLHALIAGRLGRRTSPWWWALAAIFVYLSLDEMVQLHEMAIWFRPEFNPGGMFNFNWVVVAGPLLIVGGAAFLPFLARLPRTNARRILIAGFVFVGGAYGMEMLGSHLFTLYGGEAPVFRAVSILEEGMEMAGLSLFISALLDLLAAEAPVMTFRLGRESDA